MGRLLVAASFNWDEFLYVDKLGDRGATVTVDAEDEMPGGKGNNVAIAGALSGVPTVALGAVGSDPEGQKLLAFLQNHGVDARHVRVAPGRSGKASIPTDPEDNVVYYRPGANSRVTPENLLAVQPEADDVLVAQFELPLDAVEAFLRQGKEAGATTMLNPSPVRTDARHLLALADIVLVNARELAAYAGMPPSDQLGGEEVQRGARLLLSRPDQTVVVSLGKHGSYALTPHGQLWVPPRTPRQVRGTAGAGDCLYAWIGAGVLEGGGDFGSILFRASVAASLSVEQPGTATAMPARRIVDAEVAAQTVPGVTAGGAVALLSAGEARARPPDSVQGLPR